MPGLSGEGGGGVPVSFNSKTFKDIEVKFGRVEQNHNFKQLI